MKKVFKILTGVLLLTVVVIWFGAKSYRFSAKLLLLPAFYFAIMAYTSDKHGKAISALRRFLTFLAIFGLVATFTLCRIIVTEAGGENHEPCDFVIVLGAGLRKDIPTRTLADRLEEALGYLDEYPEAVAIVSGSQGKDETVTEAYAMKKYLVGKGIDPERIIEEANADNTHENMQFSRAVIEKRGGGRVAVISSDYHLYRSKRLAENAGLSPVMISAKTSSFPLFVNCLLREAFALIKTYLVFI